MTSPMKTITAEISDLGQILADKLWFTATVDGETYENLSLAEVRVFALDAITREEAVVCEVSVADASGKTITMQIEKNPHQTVGTSKYRSYRLSTVSSPTAFFSHRKPEFTIDSALGYLSNWVGVGSYEKKFNMLCAISDPRTDARSPSYLGLLSLDVLSFVIVPLVRGSAT